MSNFYYGNSCKIVKNKQLFHRKISMRFDNMYATADLYRNFL